MTAVLKLSGGWERHLLARTVSCMAGMFFTVVLLPSTAADAHYSGTMTVRGSSGSNDSVSVADTLNEENGCVPRLGGAKASVNGGSFTVEVTPTADVPDDSDPDTDPECVAATLNAGRYTVYVYDGAAYTYDPLAADPRTTYKRVHKDINCLNNRTVHDLQWHALGELVVDMSGFGQGSYNLPALPSVLATSDYAEAGAVCITNDVPTNTVFGSELNDRGNQVPLRLLP